jgi:CTP synthase (UTP-ammonia lyase)
MTKYILVSGGVVSGIGKGVIGMYAPATHLRNTRF